MTESEATNDAIAEHNMTQEICFDITLLLLSVDTPNTVAPLPQTIYQSTQYRSNNEC